MSRPTVLCDADGVLLNFTQAYLDVIEELTGEKHTPAEVTGWHFHECPFFIELVKKWPALKQEVEEYITQEPGFCWDIAPLAGAQEGFARLEGVADVYIVTSPWHSSETWVPERTQALYTLFDVPASRVVHTAAKHLVAGDMLIDDKIGNLTNWRHGKAVLWNSHHNLDVHLDDTPIVRAYDWQQVVAMAGRL